MIIVDDANANTLNNGVMAENTASTTILVLDESSQEQQFDKKHLSNGIQSPHINDKPEGGILSMNDIQLLLSIFDKGSFDIRKFVDK